MAYKVHSDRLKFLGEDEVGKSYFVLYDGVIYYATIASTSKLGFMWLYSLEEIESLTWFKTMGDLSIVSNIRKFQRDLKLEELLSDGNKST